MAGKERGKGLELRDHPQLQGPQPGEKSGKVRKVGKRGGDFWACLPSCHASFDIKI